MAEAQLALLLGTLIGGLIGFFSTFLVNKWNKDNYREQEIRKILENRLNMVENYLTDMLESSNKTFSLAIWVMEKNAKYEAELSKSLDRFAELSYKSHITLGLLSFDDQELGNHVLEIHNEFAKLRKSCIVIMNKENENEAKEELVNAGMSYQIIRNLYGQIVLRMDSIKINKLGKKPKGQIKK